MNELTLTRYKLSNKVSLGVHINWFTLIEPNTVSELHMKTTYVICSHIMSLCNLLQNPSRLLIMQPKQGFLFVYKNIDIWDLLCSYINEVWRQ